MIIGTVLGLVKLNRAVPGAAERRFVQARCGELLVTALDPVGVQPGELVLLAAGENASRMCQEVSVDAVVLGIVESGNNG